MGSSTEVLVGLDSCFQSSVITDVARRSRKASLTLKSLSHSKRTHALSCIYQSLQASRSLILFENTVDVKSAKQNVSNDTRLSSSLIRRLEMSDKKFERMLSGIQTVATFDDPIGVIQMKKELDNGLILKKITCPIGVICVIFESRPEVVVDIACLAIMSGNAVILKGGKEAEKTNRILNDCVRRGLKNAQVNQDIVQIVETRAHVQELLKCEEFIDLIIPRGSNSLVRFIKANTKIPVMGHADGLCAVYVDKDADGKKACDIVVDSKVQYPAVCNAAETLLVHKDAAKGLLPSIIVELTKAGVQLRCDAQSLNIANTVSGAECVQATEEDYDTEFLNLVMAIKIVDSVEEAVAHINAHGSGHTDAIVTENSETASAFMANVDSAGTYHNASTRFADGYRYGFGAEVGVSTNRTHARGPVGLEGLLIYKYQLAGDGHIVAPYASGEKKFLHQRR